MKHYSKDYMLATCFKVFDDKLVRFFTLSSMVDVGIKLRDKDELGTALLKVPNPCDFKSCVYTRLTWSVCDYIINNMSNSISATDFFVGVDKSNITITKIDFYTIKVDLMITKGGITNGKTNTFDIWDSWFIPKLLTLVTNTMTRSMFDESCLFAEG